MGAPHCVSIGHFTNPFCLGVGNIFPALLSSILLPRDSSLISWSRPRFLAAHHLSFLTKLKSPLFQSFPMVLLFWLVVYLPLWKISVSWDDELPNIWKVIKHVPNHEPVFVSWGFAGHLFLPVLWHRVSPFVFVVSVSTRLTASKISFCYKSRRL